MEGGMAMGAYGMGFGGVLMWLLLALVIILPFWRILPRAGIPSWVAIFSILPGVALILLWVLAFKRWPGDRPSEA